MRRYVVHYGWGPVFGIVVLFAALATAGWTGWHVARIPPLPYPVSAESPALPEPVAPQTLSAGITAATLDRDPFHPERRGPTQRFRLPGERVTNVPAAGQPRAEPEDIASSDGATPQPVSEPSTDIRLTGTIVLPGGGGTALIERSQSTGIVRVGERVGDLTLTEVTAESATFTAPDGSRVVIRVSRTGGEL